MSMFAAAAIPPKQQSVCSLEKRGLELNSEIQYNPITRRRRLLHFPVYRRPMCCHFWIVVTHLSQRYLSLLEEQIQAHA
jgi:hypothetical protein